MKVLNALFGVNLEKEEGCISLTIGYFYIALLVYLLLF